MFLEIESYIYRSTELDRAISILDAVKHTSR